MTNATRATLFAILFHMCAAAQESRPTTTTSIYDVRDLVGQAAAPATQNVQAEPPLMEAIRAFLPPPMGPRSLAWSSGQLIATLTDTQHAWLEAFLEASRNQPPSIFRVETQFVVVSGSQARQLGVENGAPAYVPDDRALSAVRDQLADMQGAFVGPIESTEIVGGRAGREELFSEMTYIKGYETHANVEPGNRTLVLPVLATAREGTFLDVLAVGLPDRRIGSVLVASLTTIEKPVASRETKDGPVATPVVTTLAIEAKATFDGVMTIIFPGAERDGRLPLVLTKVSRRPK